ncbi:MAG: respiratory nitrate reductase subunit gamma [Candidatus Caldarchaeum sp.]|nr:respiratory nitrate reductase subunit gamma [Candidatus Caldarchaeum sp.]
MEPVRETYGMMPPGTDIMMYLVLAPFAALFVYGVFYRVRRLGVVNTGEVFKGLFAGVGYLVKFGLLQRKVVSERLAGLMHLLIYSGIIALFIGTTLVFLDHDILRFFEIRILRGDFYLFYEASLDFMGLALLAGLGILLYRRMVAHESRLRPRSEYVMVLAGLLFIGVSGYVLEGVRLAVEPRPWGGWSFVGKALSSLFSAAASDEVLLAVYRGFWWSHAVVAFAMVALIPYSSLGHMFSTLLHIALNAPKQDPLGKMHTPFKLDELESVERDQAGVQVCERAQLDAAPRAGGLHRLRTM